MNKRKIFITNGIILKLKYVLFLITLIKYFWGSENNVRFPTKLSPILSTKFLKLNLITFLEYYIKIILNGSDINVKPSYNVCKKNNI